MKFLFLILLTMCLVVPLEGFSQKHKAPQYTSDDIELICNTMEGTYKALDGDSAAMTLRIVPVEKTGDVNRMYAELFYDSIDAPIEQKVFDIVPVSSKVYKVFVRNINDGARFAHADKTTLKEVSNKVKGKKKYYIYRTKTSDFQTRWNGRKSFKSLQKGDYVHFKFSDEEGRFYVKRVPHRTTRILGTTFVKQD